VDAQDSGSLNTRAERALLAAKRGVAETAVPAGTRGPLDEAAAH